MNKKFLLCIIASLALCASACTESKSHHSDDPHSTACEELGISKSLNKIINAVDGDIVNVGTSQYLYKDGKWNIQ